MSTTDSIELLTEKIKVIDEAIRRVARVQRNQSCYLCYILGGIRDEREREYKRAHWPPYAQSRIASDLRYIAASELRAYVRALLVPQVTLEGWLQCRGRSAHGRKKNRILWLRWIRERLVEDLEYKRKGRK